MNPVDIGFWLIIVLYVFNPIAGIYMIGKERGAYTKGSAVFNLVVSVLTIAVLLQVYRRGLA